MKKNDIEEDDKMMFGMFFKRMMKVYEGDKSIKEVEETFKH